MSVAGKVVILSLPPFALRMVSVLIAKSMS